MTITEEGRTDKIIVDTRIVQVDEEKKFMEDFSEEWETIFKADRIKTDLDYACQCVKFSHKQQIS